MRYIAFCETIRYVANYDYSKQQFNLLTKKFDMSNLTQFETKTDALYILPIIKSYVKSFIEVVLFCPEQLRPLVLLNTYLFPSSVLVIINKH